MGGGVENVELPGREVYTYRPGSEEEKQVSRTDTFEGTDGAHAAGVEDEKGPIYLEPLRYTEERECLFMNRVVPEC